MSNSTSNDSAAECVSLLEYIHLDDPRVIGSLVPLGILVLLVIFGNIMVIAAVHMTQKLRGATNLFIVSLAWADLMLGIIVLPTSAMYEVFNIWIFGSHWCAIWLAVDVWMCTASILHLVVISLDRYIAVTHPVTYPNIMSSKRAKFLILGAWILSFVICFPPLVGWNEDKDLYEEDSVSNSCQPRCELIQEPGYVIYSAVGSFYGPMLVMLFFNYKIYRTATKTTKAIRKGWTTVKVGQEEMGMGIHRGGGGGGGPVPSTSNRLSAATKRYSSSTPYINGIKRDKFEGILMEEETAKLLLAVSKNHGRDKLLSVQYTTTKRCAHGNHKTFVEMGTQTGEETAEATSSEKSPQRKTHWDCCWRWKKKRKKASSDSRKNSNTLVDWSDNEPPEGGSSGRSNPPTHRGGIHSSSTKLGKRNIKSQVRRFRMETKAAKTLGIIVGCFICCWFPFFTMYLITAFCADCVPGIVFSVFFWMGYCNSAFNPFIYAMFSREFRGAFKKIICKILCRNVSRNRGLAGMGFVPIAPRMAQFDMILAERALQGPSANNNGSHNITVNVSNNK